MREGEGWQEKIVGEHDLLYFSLRNLIFEKEITDQTDGLFHVLSLVDGEKVRVDEAYSVAPGTAAILEFR